MYVKRNGIQPNAEEIQRISTELDLEPVIAEILLSRGMQDADAIRRFLSPDLESPLPFLDCPSKTAALSRIRQAVEKGERICIYGDYDADGVCATAIFFRTLKKMNADVFYYIPHRREEGYGMHMSSVRKVAEQGAELVITVDCGITSREEVALCRSLGMDVVVTDHHSIILEKIPDTIVVNPHIDSTACTSLSGAGVAYFLCRELAGESDDICVLAGIAALGDSMPVDELNRTIIVRCFAKFATCNLPGLIELAKSAGLNPETVTAGNMAFGIIPRINAAGRMGSARTAVDLFAEDRMENVAILNEQNAERQDICTRIGQEAEEMMTGEIPDVIVLQSDSWNPTIVGIAASRVTENFHRPTILLGETKEDGTCAGSARSIDGFDVFRALNACSDLFTHYGGHAMAAGMTLAQKNIPLLAKRLNDGFAALPNREEILEKKEVYDCDLPLSAVTLRLAEQAERFEPCGAQNEAPVFHIRPSRIVSWKIVGKTSEHVRVTMEQNGTEFTAIAFGAASAFLSAERPLLLEGLASVSVNEFKGKCSPSLQLTSYCLYNAEKLLALYEQGETPYGGPKLTRDILGFCWRDLKKYDGTLHFAEYAARSEVNIVAVAVLRELGLLKLAPDGIIKLLQGNVDLQNSKIFKRLSE